jgi:hypothetical protein
MTKNKMMRCSVNRDPQSSLESIYEQRDGLVRIEYHEIELTWILSILSDIDGSVRHRLIAASKNEAILLYTRWLYANRKVII